MTRSKLSASDREELIRLFKETTETITSLASQFEVSISTARRVLKTQLSAEEYEAIVARRQGGRQAARKQNLTASTSKAIEATSQDSPPTAAKTSSAPNKTRRRRRRSSAAEESTTVTVPENRTPPMEESSPKPHKAPPVRPQIKAPVEADLPEIEETESDLEVLPIDAASLPNQCYLVVDRSSELITPPLKEFAELGRIPSTEESAKTLPIFANHKIASRFSRRSQRIIKVPNRSLLQKTYPLLNAKGIERILFDGKVFTLTSNDM